MTKIHKTLSQVAALLFLVTTVGCAHVDEYGQPDPDPWESWNRPVTSFNDTVDKIALKPLAVGYRKVMPEVGEDAVGRFFDNLGEVSNAVNNLLQGEPVEAAESTGRFLVNSTLGVAGLFEVANSMGLEKEDGEDFGQTLGVWGVGSGPYFVIPFLGPSTLRDAPAGVVDYYLDPVNYVEDTAASNVLTGVGLIHARAGLLDSEALISGDRYIFIRDAYLQRRDYLINDGELDDDFSDFLDDDF